MCIVQWWYYFSSCPMMFINYTHGHHCRCLWKIRSNEWMSPSLPPVLEKQVSSSDSKRSLGSLFFVIATCDRATQRALRPSDTTLQLSKIKMSSSLEVEVSADKTIPYGNQGIRRCLSSMTWHNIIAGWRNTSILDDIMACSTIAHKVCFYDFLPSTHFLLWLFCPDSIQACWIMCVVLAAALSTISWCTVGGFSFNVLGWFWRQ
jgi:hypothetical protein